VIILPWPISTNAIWRAISMGGRPRNILSKKYREWKIKADAAILEQNPERISGPVSIAIELCPPNKRAFDLDNKAKCLLDILVLHQIIESDSINCVRYLTIGLADGFEGARILIGAWE
jgi:Holliday junction resolvase RusA-like endonuclease